MRDLKFPFEPAASHERLLALVEEAIGRGLLPHVRVVLARDGRSGAEWRPACGRIDLAPPGEVSKLDCRPKGPARLLQETPPVDELVARLRAAVAGGPFRVENQDLAGHGMESYWQASRRTRDWPDYGTPWPCVMAIPDAQITARPYVRDIIEAEGQIPLFDGLEHLVRHVARYRDRSGPGVDLRFGRFLVVVWDPRGRLDRFDLAGQKLTIEVAPPNQNELRLVGFAAGNTRHENISEAGPNRVEIDIGERILRAKVELKLGDELLTDAERDLPVEARIAALEGRVVPWLDDDEEDEADDGDDEHVLDGGTDRACVRAALKRALRPAFKSGVPKDEKEVQDAVEQILTTLGVTYHREKERHPVGATTFIPDFTLPVLSVAIEVKVTRPGRGEAVIQRELVQDSAGYGSWSYILAVVYDTASIIDDPARMEDASQEIGVDLLIVKH